MKILRIISLLSIDIVIGTFAMGSMAIYMLDVTMPIFWWIVLPTTVWLIYTVDHLLDAHKAGSTIVSQRHLFHLHHFKKLVPFCMAVAVSICLITMLYFPIQLLITGILIGSICVAYLLYSRFAQIYTFPKEFIIAIVYTIGIWFAPLMLSKFTFVQLLPIMLTFLTALNNIVLFSVVGKLEDLKSGFSSVAITMSEVWVIKLLKISIVFTIIISVAMVFVFQSQIKLYHVSIIFGAMNLTLWWILQYRKSLVQYDRYRIIGDAIFILPLILYLI